jgi:hypothetical protein
LHSHQKARKINSYVEQVQMHCLDQNKWHQIVSESRLKGK